MAQPTPARSDFLTSLQQGVRYHGVPLALLTITILLGQFLELHGGIHPILTADSPGYYQLAAGISRHFYDPYAYVQPFRTPGYPVFLAVIFAITGLWNYNAVVIAQALFLAAAFYEIYVLAFLIMRNRWIALGIAAFMSLDLFLLDNELQIMTETFSLWALVTVFLLIERYVTKESWSYAVALGVGLFLVIMVRPIFLFLPPVLLVVLAAQNFFKGPLRQQWSDVALRQRWLRIAGVGAIVYIGIFGYMKINQHHNSYYGISYVSNVNLLGKIIVYGMVHDSASSYFDPFHNELIAYYDSGQREPWNLVEHSPYSGSFFSNASGLSLSIIRHNPIEFGSHSISAIITAWQIPVGPNNLDSNGAFAMDLRQLDLTFFWLTYLLLPLALIGAGYLVWRTRGERAAMLLFIITLVVVAQIVMIGGASYGGFDRLRLPVDWMAPFATVGVIAALARFFLVAPEKAPAEGDLETTVKRPAITTTSTAKQEMA